MTAFHKFGFYNAKAGTPPQHYSLVGLYRIRVFTVRPNTNN